MIYLKDLSTPIYMLCDSQPWLELEGMSLQSNLIPVTSDTNGRRNMSTFEHHRDRSVEECERRLFMLKLLMIGAGRLHIRQPSC